MTLRPVRRRLLRAVLAGTALWSAPAFADPLQPWQMVRSLQLVQDRVADGDRAALPMQRRLLEMIDKRLRAVTPAELAEPRNWDAVMVYATAGGNPATVKALMPDLLAAADARAAAAEAAAKAAAGEEEEADGEAQGGHAEPEESAGHPPEAAHGTPAPAGGAVETGEAAGGHGASGQAGEASGLHGADPAGQAPKHAEPDGPAGKQADANAEPAAHGETGGEAEAHPPGDGAPQAGSAEQHASESVAQPEPAPATTGGHDGPAAHGETLDTMATHSVEAAPKGEHGSGKAAGHGKLESGHGESAEKAGEKADPPPELQERDVALGVFNYGRGRETYAAQALAKVDPLKERPELGASVALIKGSLEAPGSPAAALKLLDQARLLAPGTLVEEAALRRSVPLAVASGDRARFLLASGQYVRRFLRSPYASQFADAFVSGVIRLHDGLDLEAVAAVAADMAPEQERVVYLRIARAAGIDNLMDLSAFAAAKAGAEPGRAATSPDPRTILYTALSEVTGEKTGDALARLEKLDPRGLTASDGELLEAVRAVALETTRIPEQLPAEPSPAPVPPPDQKAGPPAEPEQAGAPGETQEAAADPVEAGMAATRKALADVDRLLTEEGR